MGYGFGRLYADPIVPFGRSPSASGTEGWSQAGRRAIRIAQAAASAIRIAQKSDEFDPRAPARVPPAATAVAAKC
jgi:hypothetical protein